MVLSDLLLSILTDIGTALELVGWSIGEELATGGLMTPTELDDDLVRSTIGTGGLGFWIRVLAIVADTLGAIRPRKKMMIISFVSSFFFPLLTC